MANPLAALSAHAALWRLPDAAVAFGATCIGSRLAALDSVDSSRVLELAMSNTLLFAASVVFNDWHDIGEDAINKPGRAIVSGRVSREVALAASGGLASAALALAAVVGATFLVAACVVTMASAAYTLRLKRTPVVGNVVVALVSTYALACWMLVTPPSASYVIIVAACIAGRFGGELIKTAEDAWGDAAYGLRTSATVWGVESTSHAGLAALSVGLALLMIPVIRESTNATYQAMLGLSGVLTVGSWVTMLRRRLGRPAVGTLITIERTVTVLMTVGVGLGLRPDRP